MRKLLLVGLIVTSQLVASAKEGEAPYSWLKKLFSVGHMIEKMDKMALKCTQPDCTYQLSCESFFGMILGSAQRAEVVVFEKLLGQQNRDDIAAFMVNVSNDKKLTCARCKQYAGWEKVETEAVTIKEDGKRHAMLKHILLTACYASPKGKKLRAKVQKMKKTVKQRAASKQGKIKKDSEEQNNPSQGDERLLLPGYFVDPNMNGVYADWIDGYQLLDIGRGVVRFTADMANDITIALSSIKDVTEGMYEIALGTDSNTKVQIRREPQGSPVAEANFSVTGPVTIEITFDWLTNTIAIKQVELDGSKTMLLEYDDFESDDLQYFSFTGVDAGGRISDVHVNRVVYPALKTLNGLDYVSMVALQSQADNNFLTGDGNQFIRSTIPEDEFGSDFFGFFVMLTDNDFVIFIDISDEGCGVLRVLPKNYPEPFVVRSVQESFSEFNVFFPEFEGDTAYLRSLSTKGYMSNPLGGKVTTANLIGERTDKGPLERFYVRMIDNLFI